MRDTGQSALPGDGEAVVAGVRLPAGKRISPVRVPGHRVDPWVRRGTPQGHQVVVL